MNGAETLLRTLLAGGVDTCFMNPGTSEMHFVAALDKVPGMRSVLGLFEGAVTGMADGYGRIAGRPAATLLHLGPGLANGLANLHNARRAGTPLINIVGDHATGHLRYDAPLASDIAGFARPVSHWVHSAVSADTVGSDTARAISAARAAPGQIATLILPADVAWGESEGPADPLPHQALASVPTRTISRVAERLQSATNPAILLRGEALTAFGIETAQRIAATTGAALLADTFAPRQRRGAPFADVRTIPYFAEQILEFLAPFDLLVLVGAKPPVSFFAYPDKASWCVPDHTRLARLALAHEDACTALSELADHLGAKAAAKPDVPPPTYSRDRLDQYSVGAIIGALMPEDCIISEEAATNGPGIALGTQGACPHDYLRLTGGSIGQALPAATGAAIAAPDRKVICASGDGGAMYTLQALWTQARERLDVTTIIFANRSYAILNVEMQRMGFTEPGPVALSMLDLHDPAIDWCKLARGMGVEASTATTVAEFESQFEDAMRSRGPRLIEVVV